MSATLDRQARDDVRDQLAQAIAASSGFLCWQHENGLTAGDRGELDRQVRAYLCETLATLAY